MAIKTDYKIGDRINPTDLNDSNLVIKSVQSLLAGSMVIGSISGHDITIGTNISLTSGDIIYDSDASYSINSIGYAVRKMHNDLTTNMSNFTSQLNESMFILCGKNVPINSNIVLSDNDILWSSTHNDGTIGKVVADLNTALSTYMSETNAKLTDNLFTLNGKQVKRGGNTILYGGDIKYPADRSTMISGSIGYDIDRVVNIINTEICKINGTSIKAGTELTLASQHIAYNAATDYPAGSIGNIVKTLSNNFAKFSTNVTNKLGSTVAIINDKTLPYGGIVTLTANDIKYPADRSTLTSGSIGYDVNLIMSKYNEGSLISTVTSDKVIYDPSIDYQVGSLGYAFKTLNNQYTNNLKYIFTINSKTVAQWSDITLSAGDIYYPDNLNTMGAGSIGHDVYNIKNMMDSTGIFTLCGKSVLGGSHIDITSNDIQYSDSIEYTAGSIGAALQTTNTSIDNIDERVTALEDASTSQNTSSAKVSIIQRTSVDINEIATHGTFYINTSTMINGPIAGENTCYMNVIKTDSSFYIQTYYSKTGQIWHRVYANNAYTTWIKITN